MIAWMIMQAIGIRIILILQNNYFGILAGMSLLGIGTTIIGFILCFT
jgi:hypothetical protein